jgi:prepilin-type N-terminal cleavage/methylation domain-containing protein
MRDARRHRDPAGQAGFTVVELMVAMTLSLVVLLAVLQTLDVFTKSAGGQSRATDANDQVRRAMDRVVNDLRGAAVIRTAAATDLVYSVAETTGTRTERLCLSGTLLLYRASSTTKTVPTSACGTPDAGWTLARVANLPATSATAFSYDGAASSATPATVKSVGLTLSLSAAGNGLTSTSTLRASATLRRAAGTLPLTGDAVVPVCNQSGALLTLDAAATGGLGALNVTYRTAAGVLLGSATGSSSVQISTGVTALVATITDAAGVSTTVQKTVECV